MSTDEKELYCPFGNEVRQVREPGDVHKVGRRPALEAEAAEALTISLWIAVDEPPGSALSAGDPHGVILEKWSGKGGYPYALHYLRQAAGAAGAADAAGRGTLRASRSDGKSTAAVRSKTKVDDGRFHHVAFVREHESGKARLLLYVDGVLEDVAGDITTNKTANRAPLTLGARLRSAPAAQPAAPVLPFFGLMRHLAMYRRALAPAEISQLAAERISPVLITAIHYRGKVKHSQADEYIELVNWDASAVDISGWQVGSERGRRVFVFPPATVLAPRQRVRVYSNQVHAAWGGYTFASGSAIWNDQGDLGILRDMAGKEISRWTYGDAGLDPRGELADAAAMAAREGEQASAGPQALPSPAGSIALTQEALPGLVLTQQALASPPAESLVLAQQALPSPAGSPALDPAPSAAAAAGEPEAHAAALARRQAQAEDVVRRSVYWAGGISLVPVPLADIAGTISVILMMLQELAELYEVRFSKQRARSLVAALLGGVGGVGVGASMILSVAKIMPVVGWVVAGLAAPTAAMVSTYAVGKVFLLHFEAGGTLLDFDPAAMRGQFRDQLRQAPDVVAAMRNNASSSL